MKKVTLLLPVLCMLFNLQAQLAGTYTIDSKSPTNKKQSNFNSLTEATNALSTQGLKGDVTFELVDEEYTQPLVIEDVYNDLGYLVHFTSQKETVLFTNKDLSLSVSNSSYLSFSNLKFKAKSTENSSMVVISNSSNIILESNEFYASEDAADFKNIVTISISSDNNMIANNTFRGTGAVSIKRMSNHNKIINNNIYFQGNGIEVLSSSNTMIEGNSLKAMNKENTQGILLNGLVGQIYISSNTIRNAKNGIAQEVIFRPSSEKASGSIVNNMIESVGDALSLNNNVSDLKIAFNTMKSDGGSAIVLREEIKGSIDKVTLHGNQLISRSEESAIVNFSSDKLISRTDYNNLYNEEGTFIVKVGSLEFKSIVDWKQNMRAEHAISSDPRFVQTGYKVDLLSDRMP